MYKWVTRFAAALSLPLATHLAETSEEREFIARGSGPQRELLERLGVWHDDVLAHIGRGQHPVEHLAGVLHKRPFLAAHVNDADDRAIETLVRSGTSVAYCPRASAYFGAERHFGPHRYPQMLAAGVNVALGTDSIVNLPASTRDDGISILDEMRLLFKRDGTDARVLLKMATINGAAALGLDQGVFMFRSENDLAGLVAVEVDGDCGDPLGGALSSDSRPRLLLPAT
jgi:cytosine/adenosine deaminase-related metal-dependent hydrolase